MLLALETRARNGMEIGVTDIYKFKRKVMRDIIGFYKWPREYMILLVPQVFSPQKKFKKMQATYDWC